MELAKSLKVECVSRLPITEPHFVHASQLVVEAVHEMRLRRVGCLLVREGIRLVGILTERDIVRRVLAPRKPLSISVQSCMTPDPVVVRLNEPISLAIRRMQEGGYRHLPVLDEASHLVGVLSVKRIVHYLVEHFPATIYYRALTQDVPLSTREGA